MAQISYRANLSSATFPMTVAKSGRSVIIPGPDQNFDRRVDAPGDTQRGSVGIPQVIYMENVLPTDEGYQSVGFTTDEPFVGATSTIAYLLDLTISAVSPTSGNVVDKLYVAFFNNGTIQKSTDLINWQGQAVTPPALFKIPRKGQVSIARVGDRIFMCCSFAGTKLYELLPSKTLFPGGIVNFTITDITATIQASLPGGINIIDIRSIAGSYNYLIIATESVILWSSTTTPTDFSPSLVSGAGNEIPNNLSGRITFLKSHVAGFYIATNSNVLLALYTGNQRYPWKFKEIKDSGGYMAAEQLAGNTNSLSHYGVNNARQFQVVSGDSCNLTSPEVTEFLAANEESDEFDFTANAINTSVLDRTVAPEVFYVSDRYIIVGYVRTLQGNWYNSIVYDTLLNRVGKLRVFYDIVIEKNSTLYFVNYFNRAVYTLQFDKQVDAVPSYRPRGCIVLGKFQYARSRFICLDQVDVESIKYRTVPGDSDKNFALFVYPTLDGKTLLPVVAPYDATSAIPSTRVAKYLCHSSCQNFAIALIGHFDLNTIEMKFHVEGDM
jgi:hypothetical protein